MLILYAIARQHQCSLLQHVQIMLEHSRSRFWYLYIWNVFVHSCCDVRLRWLDFGLRVKRWKTPRCARKSLRCRVIPSRPNLTVKDTIRGHRESCFIWIGGLSGTWSAGPYNQALGAYRRISRGKLFWGITATTGSSGDRQGAFPVEPVGAVQWYQDIWQGVPIHSLRIAYG